jgi:hypothetical protein
MYMVITCISTYIVHFPRLHSMTQFEQLLESAVADSDVT